MKRAGILIVTVFLSVAGLLTSCGGTQNAELAAFNTAKTTAEANKALVRRYFDAVNQPDLKGFEDQLSPNYKRYASDNSAPITVEQNKKRLLGFHAVCPDDFHLTIVDIVAEGDLVTVHNTFTGTQKGAFVGIPPTGKKVTVWDAEVFRIENGKIIEQTGGPDLWDLIQQIGGVVSAGK